MRLYSEESFGPIVAIVPVDGVDEAVRVANDTGYGLQTTLHHRAIEERLACRRSSSG